MGELDGNGERSASGSRLALKAGALYMIAELVTRGISFLTTPVFTRLLPPEVFADTKVYESWAHLLAPVISLCLYLSMVRAKFDYAGRYNQYLSSTLCLMTLIAGGSIGILWMLADFFVQALGFSIDLLTLMLLYCLAYNGIQCVQLYDRQILNYRRNIVLTFLGVLPSAAVSVILVWRYSATASNDMLCRLKLAGFFLPVTLIGIGLIAHVLWKERNFCNLNDWKYGCRYSVPLIAATVASQIFFQSPSIMVQKLLGSDAAALVVVAMTIGYIMDILAHAVDNAWKPWMFEQLHAENYESIRKIWMIVFGAMSLTAWCIVMTAPELVLILGGQVFQEAVLLVCPITCASLLNFIVISDISIEQYYSKTKICGQISVISSVAVLALELAMIPRFGYQAAVFSMVAGYLAGCLLHNACIRRFDCHDVLCGRKTWLLLAGVSGLCWGSTLLHGFAPWKRWGVAVAAVVVVLCLALKKFLAVACANLKGGGGE